MRESKFFCSFFLSSFMVKRAHMMVHASSDILMHCEKNIAVIVSVFVVVVTVIVFVVVVAKTVN